MWEGCAAQISRDFQFSCGQYYPGLRLLRPLPVQELLCWTFDLTLELLFPLVITEANQMTTCNPR